MNPFGKNDFARGAGMGAALACLLFACGAQGATNLLTVGFAEYSIDGKRLSVADVSNPKQPLAVCHYDFGEFLPTGLAVTNGVLEVSGDVGAVLFDVSDIFAPVISSVCSTNGNLLAARPNVVVAGGFAVFSRPCGDGTNGWEIVTAALPEGTGVPSDGELAGTAGISRLGVGRPCRLACGPSADSLIGCDGSEAFTLRISAGGGIFAEAPFFVSTNEAAGPVSAVYDPRGLILLACRTDGVRIFAFDGDSPPVQVTRCVTAGEARDVALLPGGFAVALGVSGVALYDLNPAGLVSKRGQWPLPAGSASAVFASDGMILAACEEVPVAYVATNGVALHTAPRTEHPAISRMRLRLGAAPTAPEVPRPVADLLKMRGRISASGDLASCGILPNGGIIALDEKFHPVFVGRAGE